MTPPPVTIHRPVQRMSSVDNNLPPGKLGLRGQRSMDAGGYETLYAASPASLHAVVSSEAAGEAKE